MRGFVIALLMPAILTLTAPPALPAGGEGAGLDPGHFRRPASRALRTVPGDLCDTAVSLARGHDMIIDLCQAWNDYDPGAGGCSPCALPGPDVVAALDTQPGERVELTAAVTAGAADVRLLLATDCEAPHASCVAASQHAGGPVDHVMSGGGRVWLIVDTTGECAEVTVSRAAPASAFSTSFSALKAVYR